MPVTGLRGRQILDGDVTRADLNTTTASQAVITRLIAGNNISITSTGVDSGTGDVTVNATVNNIYNSNGTLTANRTVTMNGNWLNFTGGNIGIGITAPTAKLDIGIHNSNADSATINVMEYSSLGNITTTGYGSVGSNYWMDNGTLKRRKSDLVTAIHFLNGGLEILTAGNAAANSTITFTSLARMFSNGNLIMGGTVDTGYKLDVNGTIRAGTDGYYGTNGTTTAPLLRFASDNLVFLDVQGYGIKTSHTLSVNSTIWGGGQIISSGSHLVKGGSTVVDTRFVSYGIGRPDVSLPAANLAGMGGFFSGTTWPNGLGLSFFTSIGTDISGGANIAERMTITPAGSVLIGTTTMSSIYTTADLVVNDSSGYTYQEIRGTQQSTLALTTGTSVGSTPAVEIYNSYNFGIKYSATGDTSFLMFYHGTNKYLSIDTNGNERMRITSTGDVGIGTSSPGARLHVDYTPPSWSANGAIGTFTAVRHTMPANSSLNSGYAVTANYSYLELTSAGSSTISQGAIMAGFVGVNRVSFSSTGTITLTQSGSNARAYAAMQVFMQTTGSVAGTITHGASLFVQGIYPVTATSITFTNYYGLLINPLDEWGTVTLTNRWGIYQAGASDRNYFGGDLILNKLAGSGTRMVVADSTGQLSTQAIPSGGGGITTLNTLTAATQTFAVGTSGTDFNISSSTSTHTFNIPDASTTARGLVNTGAQTFNGNKIIRGTSTLNTEFALTVQNSSGTNLFQVRNDAGATIVTGELRVPSNIATNQIGTWTSGNINVVAPLVMNDNNFVFGTGTGNKLGTATNQKLGFWNATPIVQPTTAVAAATFVANTGTAVNNASTFDGYTMQQVVKALRNIGLLA